MLLSFWGVLSSFGLLWSEVIAEVKVRRGAFARIAWMEVLHSPHLMRNVSLDCNTIIGRDLRSSFSEHNVIALLADADGQYWRARVL